jgi:hypothetical protein
MSEMKHRRTTNDYIFDAYRDREIDDFLSDPGDDDRANIAPPVPDSKRQ